jgi:hypothetical protein
VIPTLFPAATLKRAIDYLEEQQRRLDPEVQKSDRNAVNKAYAMALSRAVGKYPGISYKGLRAIYAECHGRCYLRVKKSKPASIGSIQTG